MKSKYAHTLGTEELARVLKMKKTREDTRAEADALFGDTAKEMRKADRAKLEKLFVQTPVAVTMAPNLQKESSVREKIAKVFGESMPELRHGSVPFEHKLPKYQKYIETKSVEEPTGYAKAGLTGAAVGGGLGLLAAVAGGKSGVPSGVIPGGAVLGGLTGLLAAAGDKKKIQKAKDIAQSGDLRHHLAEEIGSQEKAHEVAQSWEAQRRHDELMDAVNSRPMSTSTSHYHYGKYASITPSLDEFFEKNSGVTDAMRRYPELRKSAESKVHAPILRKRAPTTDSQGVPPVQSGLSGGSA